MKGIYQKVSEYAGQGDCVLFTVLEGEHACEKVLLRNGQPVYYTGTGQFLMNFVEQLSQIDESGIIEVSKDDSSTQIFAEVLGGVPKLVICGGGYVSQALARAAKVTGFRVAVLEDRASFAEQLFECGADQVICDSFDNGLDAIEGDLYTYFVVVTRGHQYDKQCLKKILQKKSAYVGMMGSRRRVELLKADLQEAGLQEHLIENVHMPIGLPIHAETPSEIAISVLAEIISTKNKKKKSEGYSKELMQLLLSNKGDNAAEHSDGAALRRMILAEIVEKNGSTPRAVGTKMLILNNGTTVGTIGGGSVEADVVSHAEEMLHLGQKHCVMHISMDNEKAGFEGQVCGGKQLIFLELI